MADLIQCPECGLRQSGRHTYCARCEYQFTGAAEESVHDDRATNSSTPATLTPTPPAAGRLNVFAGLGEGEFDDAAGSPGDSGSFSHTGRSDTPSQRRDDLPPRSDSIRASAKGDSLVADRGSLGRRLTQPAGRVAERAPPPEDDLPQAPSWSMPNRTPTRPVVPDEGDTEEAPFPPAPSDVTTSGSVPDFLVRGRPQDELYASEHSIPPEDALLADLVSGRVLEAQTQTSGDWEQPPAHPTFGDVLAPTEPLPPDGPRVVPPSVGARRPSTANRRVDPRGRSVASAPEARELDPNNAYVTPPALGAEDPDLADFDLGPTLSAPRPSSSGPLGPAGGLRPTTTAGGRTPTRPAPAKTDLGAASSTTPIPRILLRLAGLLVAGVLALAAVDGLGVARARAALSQAFDHGIGPNGPTPDLPVILRERLAELGVEGAVVQFDTQLAGATNTYRVGLQMRSKVAAFPMRWQVLREGAFAIDQRIKTLQVFVAAGWELDAVAMEQLRAYNERRRQFRETEARGAEARALADDDDSAEPTPR